MGAISNCVGIFALKLDCLCEVEEDVEEVTLCLAPAYVSFANSLVLVIEPLPHTVLCVFGHVNHLAHDVFLSIGIPLVAMVHILHIRAEVHDILGGNVPITVNIHKREKVV
eukprot:XP_001705581.1 Hypothetical protein GL50803_38244 [Giardia lamblia ATCC 50803]